VFHRLRGRFSAGRAASRIRTDTERDRTQVLAGILADIPRLQRLDGRHDLLQQADPRLRDAAPEHNVTRDHLHAIVHAAQRSGTLTSLRDALEYIEPYDVGTEWFGLAVVVLTGLPGPLPRDFMLDLIGQLHRRDTNFGRAAVQAYERHPARRPLRADRLPQALLQLYDARVPPTDPAAPRVQLLRFLDLLAAEAEAGSELARLLASVRERERERERGAGAAAVSARARRQVILQIRVEEEDAPSDLPYTHRRYSLRGYHYEGIAGAKPVFHCSWPSSGLFTGDELKARGHEFLAAWRAQEQVDWDASKRVEFLLPDSLLGYPAELWSSGSADRPISRRCQVVVRSLRRYKDDFLHDEWRRRWEALDRDCPPGDALERIGWMSPDVTGADACAEPNSLCESWSCPDSKFQPLRLTDPADVEDWLRLNPDLACLGLGTPYDYHDPLVRDAVADALLEDGIPVMVWRRDAGDPARLLDALRDSKPPALLAQLPDSVLEVRKRGRHDPASLGKQITLLWDDPTCVFRKQDSQMSGTRGAGEGAA
jgi:hypothetical protein